MAARLCRTLRADGHLCRAVAISGSTLCRAHQADSRRSRQRERCARRAVDRGRYIRLGPLATRSSIQCALGRVLQPLFAETLPLHRASHYLQRIQRASTALGHRNRTLPVALASPSPYNRKNPAIRRSSPPVVNKPSHPNAERPGAPEREQHTQDDHHASPGSPDL